MLDSRGARDRSLGQVRAEATYPNRRAPLAAARLKSRTLGRVMAKAPYPNQCEQVLLGVFFYMGPLGHP